MSPFMSSTKQGWLLLAALAGVLAGAQLIPASAAADPQVAPQPPAVDPQPGQDLHNITYRARVDGVSRGATITYAAEGGQTQTANPTMVPGRIFEANTVLPASGVANMKLSIQWPYSANLHCDILVDDQLVSQADDFIAPRFTPQNNDPDYGALTCEAPVNAPAANPAEPAPPADGPPPPPQA
jgi:hypothetical protein